MTKKKDAIPPRTEVRGLPRIQMTNASLKEVFGRLGQVQDVIRNSSGSRENVILEISGDSASVNSITATIILARRGPSMLQAKRAIEAVIDTGEVAIELAKVESRENLVVDLAAAGFRASFLPRPAKTATTEVLANWIQDVRKCTGLTQEQFAITYGFEVKTLIKYEQGESKPAAAVMSYLRTIRTDPVAVKKLRLKSGAVASTI